MAKHSFSRSAPLAGLLITTFAGLLLTTSAQEWTRFRGPNGAGLAQAKLPDQISKEDINWTCELPGSGHSSPVIWGDRIFVTATPQETGTPTDAKRLVVCVGAKDGKVAWKREFITGAYRKHADNSFASPSCAVDADRIYAWFAGPDGSQLVALDHEGKEIWKRDLGPFTTQHGAGGSPIVEGKSVILQSSQDGPGSFIAGFDAATGEPKWKNELKGGQHAISTPFLINAKSGPEIISQTSNNGLRAFDPANGKELWSVPDLFKLRCVASPVLTAEGSIIAQVGEGQATSVVYAIKGVLENKPEKAYEIVRIGGYVPSPIVAGDLLFLWKENGFVTCIRSATNEQLWSERVEGPYYASPICVGGKGGRLYNLTRGGDLVVLAADEKFKLIQRFPLSEKNSYATPAVSGGKLYVRTYTHLISIGK